MSGNSALDGLMHWYHSQCNGTWEHEYGVKIGTLDNPGWEIAIDLDGTPLEYRAFEPVSHSQDDLDWYSCRLEGSTFRAYCGPRCLSQAISVFLNWVGNTR